MTIGNKNRADCANATQSDFCCQFVIK